MRVDYWQKGSSCMRKIPTPVKESCQSIFGCGRKLHRERSRKGVSKYFKGNTVDVVVIEEKIHSYPLQSFSSMGMSDWL